MNPEAPAPSFNPESQPPSSENAPEYAGVEYAGEQTRETEQGISRDQRKDPQQKLPPQVPVTQSNVVQALPTVAQQDDSAGPTIANDDDLIEKEWVDKAKKVILETQDDPYRREEEISRLQIDYLRKRYGKELGTSN